MERASKVIRGLPVPDDTFTSSELVCAAWPQAVGKKVAACTRASKLVRDRLVVEVEDATWQKQLWALRFHILRNLEKHVGPHLVEDIEFRVMPRRREPQRAAAATAAPAPLFDEADGIADPVLRIIYKDARKKALA